MSDQRKHPRRGAHAWIRSNVLGLVAIFIALGGTAIAAQSASHDDYQGAAAAKKKKKAKPGPPGPAGPQGPPGPSTGPAGGALAGSYPNPALNVSGGPCPNGQELVNVSASAALTCSAGVYSDGSNNVAAGPTAFPALTTGAGNTALGSGANDSVSGGIGNFAAGALALTNVTLGTDNTAVGNLALFNNVTGASNIGVGTGALNNNTGSNNTAMGALAGTSLTTGGNNIAIDNSGIAAESNTIRIGDTQTRSFVAGIRGVTTGVADAIPVLIDSTGQLGTTSSSRRVKHDIHPLGSLRALMNLKPVSFRYRSGPQKLQYGLIAEQVAKAFPQLAVYGDDGLPETVQYQDLPVLLLARIQAQQREINRLEKEVYGR